MKSKNFPFKNSKISYKNFPLFCNKIEVPFGEMKAGIISQVSIISKLFVAKLFGRTCSRIKFYLNKLQIKLSK